MKRSLPAAARALPCAPVFVREPTPGTDPQAMMEARQNASMPGAPHRRLVEHFAGAWNARQAIWIDPSAPPIRETGRDVTTAEFGGRRLRTVFTGRFAGEPFEGAAIKSCDHTTGKYVSHWIDGLSTGQFTAEGDHDPATRARTLHGR